MNFNHALKSILLLSLALIISQCSTFEENTWYVSPTGSDANNGSEASPFLSLSQALEVSRQVQGEKHIVVKEGNYYGINLVINSSDSLLTIEAEKGASPILFGGQIIENWQKEGDFLYAALEGTRNRDWDFRMIQVNGEWRNRARLPEKGAFTHLNEFNVRWLSSEAGGWERKPTIEERTTLKYKPEDLSPDIDINNAELTIYHEWDESLVGLKAKDIKNHILEFENASQHPPGAFASRNPNAQTFVVWNTKEGMLNPGQWYLDRTRERLYYWPKEGENETNIEVVVPRFQNIIAFNEGASNVIIKGLTLSSTSTELITGGYGALKFEGAISGSGVSNISLTNLDIVNVGGWAVKLRGDDINITNSEIKNCGAGAIHYRGENVNISHNMLHDIGLIYYSALGISGSGNYNTISHNEIWNMPYCGIGGVGSNSLIDGNIIHNIKTFMHDGGAMHMGWHKKTVLSNNVVLSNPKSGIIVYAYYFDENCDSCVAENNLAYNTTVPVLAHMTRNCTYRNNIFLDNGPQIIKYANSFNMVFDKNILVAESIEFEGPSEKSANNVEGKLGKVMSAYSSANGIISWQNNIFHSISGNITHKVKAQYATFETISLQPVQGTIFTDPVIEGISTGILTYGENSPAKANGIQLRDFSSAGNGTELSELIKRYYTE
ncbi:right-handed parallel beta-helix repeat-containing protein [Bacteroidota bacterium]